MIAEWIGRTESRDDVITPAPMAALAATLDRDDPFPRAGDPVPLLWHWLYFLPVHRRSALAPDGHARLGEFLPPVPLPRRMYAGGSIDVRHPLCVGDPVRRVSRIVDITEKSGRSGPLIFVRVRHEISNPTGVALIEEHTIVYRDHAPRDARAIPAGSPTDDGDRVPAVSGFRGTITPDEVLLFRYSALTFNGYRIHYDRRFATDEQGYSGLVVHAPLLATLLADLLRRHVPDVRISHFSFRALHPLFDGQTIVLHGRPNDERTSIALWADAEGRMAFEAAALLRSSP